MVRVRVDIRPTWLWAFLATGYLAKRYGVVFLAMGFFVRVSVIWLQVIWSWLCMGYSSTGNLDMGYIFLGLAV